MLPEKTIWDEIVSDHEHVWDQVNFIGREAMVGFLNPGESVLDVGCGNGFVYRSARDKGVTFSRYVGVDLSTKFIEAAQKLSPEIDWRRGDAEQLEFKDEEFDVVIMMHMLECLDGFEKAVMEALRVSKDRVVVCFWKQFAEKTEIKPTDPHGYESVYSKEDWFAFLEKIGMPTVPWVEVHAEENRSNLFFVLEKKNLKVPIVKEAPPEVQQAIRENKPPNEYTDVKRDVEQENLTWNPPIDVNEPGPEIVKPGHAAPPKEEEVKDELPTPLSEDPTETTVKGLFSDTFRVGEGNKVSLTTAIIDSDDLSDEYDPYDMLVDVKSRFPKFKITLFAIPTKCSPALIKKYDELDWVELAVHGYTHDPNTEFQNATYEETDMKMLAGFVKLGARAVKLFKAPGWQISDPTLQWLKDNDWAVMDQYYNNERRPEGLKTLVYADNPKEDGGAFNVLHTHTWDCCDNDIHKMLQHPPFDAETEFLFVSEAAKPWSKSSD